MLSSARPAAPAASAQQISSHVTSEPTASSTRAEADSPHRPDAEPHEPQGTTAAQLRRFIRSRPYVPLHELRRRFEMNGQTDDVIALRTPAGPAFIGLPAREGALIEELVRVGEVGLELCQDPDAPVVMGVFPMRPAARS